ncbi:MAG: hypoxanthine phosphoribosyltransferase [Anaerolineaceae bacterium]|nr:hypoxanthine phosphoribosyltransferase [Anaerolineaceae bacterium]
MQKYQEFLERILISEEELQRRIQELAEEIDRDYADSNGLILVCVLRGGIMFLVDLMRKIKTPHMIDFMAVSSYGVGKRRSSGQARITLDLNTDIRGRDVLIVEDIIDSGHSMHSLIHFLESREPNSLNVCALLDKAERREVDIPIRYAGFQIPNEFVFGYGLDLDEYYRNLNFVGIVDVDKLDLEEE